MTWLYELSSLRALIMIIWVRLQSASHKCDLMVPHTVLKMMSVITYSVGYREQILLSFLGVATQASKVYWIIYCLQIDLSCHHQATVQITIWSIELMYSPLLVKLYSCMKALLYRHLSTIITLYVHHAAMFVVNISQDNMLLKSRPQ